MTTTYDRILHGIPELDEIDGWSVIAFVKASDGQEWYYKIEVSKHLVAQGFWHAGLPFVMAQYKLTHSAPPFDPSTIEWSVLPWVMYVEEDE